MRRELASLLVVLLAFAGAAFIGEGKTNPCHKVTPGAQDWFQDQTWHSVSGNVTGYAATEDSTVWNHRLCI